MTTKVVFRKFDPRDGGDVIALFPKERCGKGNLIWSYQHIGQHGSASPELITELLPCQQEEYQSLLDELTSIGYDNLLIEKRAVR